VIGLLVGGSVSGAVHVAKAGLRTAATGTTGGAANPVVSAAEDGLSLSGSLLAVFYPVLFFATLATTLVILLYLLRRWRLRRGAQT
jgi:hypothetical protein